MALYFLFQNEDGTVGFDASNIDWRIGANNRGIGPYDFPPTEEMLEEVRRTGIALPHRVDLVLIGLLPPLEEGIGSTEIDENARGDFRTGIIAISLAVILGIAVAAIQKGIWSPALLDAFLTVFILGFCAFVYRTYNPQ